MTPPSSLVPHQNPAFCHNFLASIHIQPIIFRHEDLYNIYFYIFSIFSHGFFPIAFSWFYSGSHINSPANFPHVFPMVWNNPRMASPRSAFPTDVEAYELLVFSEQDTVFVLSELLRDLETAPPGEIFRSEISMVNFRMKKKHPPFWWMGFFWWLNGGWMGFIGGFGGIQWWFNGDL